MSEDQKPLEIVVEFETVHTPIYLRGFQKQTVLNILDEMRIPYTLTQVFYHGDGTSGAYDEKGDRKLRP